MHDWSQSSFTLYDPEKSSALAFTLLLDETHKAATTCEMQMKQFSQFSFNSYNANATLYFGRAVYLLLFILLTMSVGKTQSC